MHAAVTMQPLALVQTMIDDAAALLSHRIRHNWQCTLVRKLNGVRGVGGVWGEGERKKKDREQV